MANLITCPYCNAKINMYKTKEFCAGEKPYDGNDFTEIICIVCSKHIAVLTHLIFSVDSYESDELNEGEENN